MFKYTLSAISNTFDFIKRLIYFFQIVIQLGYIAYVIYRLVGNVGNVIGNAILVAISVFYILFQLLTTKEFYTKEQLLQKAAVRRTVKAIKYAANIFIIVVAAAALVNGKADNANAAMLVTVLMILGVILSLMFDIILLLINRQAALVKSAFLYDVEKFKKYKRIIEFIKEKGFDLNKEVPKFDDPKAIKKVQDMNYKQEQKSMRKRDFHKKAKKL